MQLQRELAALTGILDAGVVMGTPANRELLVAQGLWAGEGVAAGPDDLVIAVRASDAAAAETALLAVDRLLAARQAGVGTGSYRPHTMTAAFRELPASRWVLVSAPGRHATGLAREALAAGRHVFLFSDNVPLADEVALKRDAAARGLLVMGPDCGTAIVDGAAFGFANRVRRGPVGIVAASGTGAQLVATRLHALGVGVSHLFGTGGRDLSAEVGGATAMAAVAYLAADAETRVLVLISKPPDPAVAARVLAAVRASGKPVVVAFLGRPAPVEQLGNLHFARSVDDAARLAATLAARLADRLGDRVPVASASTLPVAPGGDATTTAPRFLRALFAGGTLAEEMAIALAPLLEPLHGNLPLPGCRPLKDAARSSGHTILDLGDDAFTVGRLHPMLDPELRRRRLRQEAADPTTAVILLDVVLGPGGHADPAGALAPDIAAARQEASAQNRQLAVVVLLVGTDQDPQDLAAQRARLSAAGAEVVDTVAAAAQGVAAALTLPGAPTPLVPPPLAPIAPVAAVNVGLEAFHDSLHDQGVPVIQLDWRPVAGGNERLAGLLARLR
jgi:FdrA protein